MGTNRKFIVSCAWNPDARVWFVNESNVPGLAVEARTQPALFDKLRIAIPKAVQRSQDGPIEGRFLFELLCDQADIGRCTH